MITLDKLIGSENDQSWADLVGLSFIGNGCEDHFTTTDTSIPKINILSGKKLMFYYAIFFGNLLMPRLYIILGLIKLATLSGIR